MAPGEGVTVGFIDSGIDQGNPLFDGKTIPEVFLDGAVDERGDRFSHGTAVASVVGARPNSRSPNGFYGVAWGADLKMFAIPLGGVPSRYYNPASLTGLRTLDARWAGLWRTVLGEDVDILNLSFGIEGLIENYGAQDLRTNLREMISKLAQPGVQEKTILVWTAGNAHGDPCRPGSANCVNGSINASTVQIFSGLVAKIDELQGHSIAVVAVNQNGAIADFSNRCGSAAEWCIAAPGEDVVVAYFGPAGVGIFGAPVRREIRRLKGTSFAAPMVSGSLAVIKHLFRNQLSNTELVTRLFATANKSGRYSDKAIYGQGMLDLGAASRPVGTTRIALGKTVDSGGSNVQLTGIILGRALGDGLGRSLAGQEIAAFDKLGAPFWFKLAGFTGVARGPSSLGRLHALLEQPPVTSRTAGRRVTFTPDRVGGAVEQELGYARLRVGFRETPPGVAGGHFTLAQDATTLTLTGSTGMAATAFTTAGFAGRAPASGIALAWRPVALPLGFRAGWLAEQKTLLGTTAAGAFGSLATEAAFAGLETELAVGTWQFAVNAELGTATPHLQGGMLTRMSSLTTSAFTLTGTRHFADGSSILLTLAQPLRVEDGRVALSVPVGRTKDRAVLRLPLAADLTPSGRQLDVSAQWRYPLATDNELRLEATWTHNPGHNTRANPALSLLTGWRFTF